MAEPKRPMDELEASFGKTTPILARCQTEQSRCSKHEVKQVLQG